MRSIRPAMSASHIQRLEDRGVVRVAGADAEAFLQGLVTNDMARLAETPAIYAGLLSPQGKILFEFLVVKGEDGFLLDVAASEAAELVKRLALYKLRAKVEITDRSSAYEVFTGAGGFNDPRFAELGQRAIAARAFPPTPAFAGLRPDKPALPHKGRGDRGEGLTYDSARISLGIPEGGKDYALGTPFPHEAMFDQLNGVSFSKGCYVGQEIVARMQHRGTARSRFLMVTGDGPLPPMGTVVTAGAVPLGAMGSSMGTQGLALIRLDRLADAYAVKSPVTAGGVALTLAKPPYATFEAPTP